MTNNFARRQFGITVAGTVAASGTSWLAGREAPVEGGQWRREVWVPSMALAGLKAANCQDMCDKMLARMEEVTP